MKLINVNWKNIHWDRHYTMPLSLEYNFKKLLGIKYLTLLSLQHFKNVRK